MKYIQNNYASDIQLNLKNESGTATTSIVFKRQATDRMTGQLVASGYTEIDDVLFERLEVSKAFQKCISEGKLVVCDEPPLTVNTMERLMAANEKVRQLTAENEALKARIAELVGVAETASDEPVPEKPKRGKGNKKGMSDEEKD